MNILIISNLYPLPWEQNRATFNKQQFDRLAKTEDVQILVPVAWPDYIRNRKLIKTNSNKSIKYVCFWYTPKILYGLFGWFMYFSILVGARKFIKGKVFDCVLGSWAYPDGFAAKKIASNLGKPYFIKVHGTDINVFAESGKRKEIIANVCKGASHVFVPSNALRQKLIHLGVNHLNVTRIYNGVNSGLFYPITERNIEPFFLFVGNLKKEKGVLELLSAYDDYLKNGGRYKLKYIGSGPMFNHLTSEIKSLNLTDKVELLGVKEHKDVARHIRESICLVLPSYNEGVPNVLLEAARSGVPVIATKVGGIPEIVVEEKTGLLVDAKNVSSIYKALQKIETKNDWDSDYISEYASMFTWEKNISTLKSLLKENTQ